MNLYGVGFRTGTKIVSMLTLSPTTVMRLSHTDKLSHAINRPPNAFAVANLRFLELLLDALLIAGCATNQSREMILVDTYTSNEIKRLQSSPYEVSTWAWLRGISREDIHAIETLVARHRAIRKPIL